MVDLSIGKIRALQRVSLDNDVFAILAIDHQDSLRRALDRTDDDLIAFKKDVVGTLQAEVSGVLLDPVMGAAQAVEAGLARDIGLLVELEKADYSMEPLPQQVEIDPAWSVQKIKRMSADGVKLFFYYHPDNAALAEAQNAIIRDVVADCAAWDIPLYAEPIISPNPGGPAAGTDAYRADFGRAVIESARQIAALGVDVLKMEFPIDITHAPDESAWSDACRQLSDAVDIPWVLLSAGVEFPTYLRQVEIACAAGASGFMAGRAVWGDACAINDLSQQRDWLADEGIQRIRQLSDAARKSARPWSAFYASEPISTTWFQDF